MKNENYLSFGRFEFVINEYSIFFEKNGCMCWKECDEHPPLRLDMNVTMFQY